MLHIYIGFQVIKFHCFPSSLYLLFFPPPPPPNFYCFPPPPHLYCFPSFSTSSFYCFLSFASSFHFFSPRDSIKDCQVPSLVHFEAVSRVVNSNRGFLQLLADCPSYQRQFIFKTASPQQLPALVQVLYNIVTKNCIA